VAAAVIKDKVKEEGPNVLKSTHGPDVGMSADSLCDSVQVPKDLEISPFRDF